MLSENTRQHDVRVFNRMFQCDLGHLPLGKYVRGYSPLDNFAYMKY